MASDTSIGSLLIRNIHTGRESLDSINWILILLLFLYFYFFEKILLIQEKERDSMNGGWGD